MHWTASAEYNLDHSAVAMLNATALDDQAETKQALQPQVPIITRLDALFEAVDGPTVPGDLPVADSNGSRTPAASSPHDLRHALMASTVLQPGCRQAPQWHVLRGRALEPSMGECRACCQTQWWQPCAWTGPCPQS